MRVAPGQCSCRVDPDDPEDDGDPDGDGDPNETDPYTTPSQPEKPWLMSFRAPTDPQEREALWGPVIGTWSTPEGECREFESGVQLCDNDNGSTFVWISEDLAMWMQLPGGGKQWMSRPGGAAGDPPGGGSGGDGDGDHYEADLMDEMEANLVARHALFDDNEQPRGRIIPGARMDSPSDVEALAEYLMKVVNEIERSREYNRLPINGQGPQYRRNNEAKGYWDNVNGNVVVRWPAPQQSQGTALYVEDVDDNGEDYFRRSFPLYSPSDSSP